MNLLVVMQVLRNAEEEERTEPEREKVRVRSCRREARPGPVRVTGPIIRGGAAALLPADEPYPDNPERSTR